jgi:hypothetical protein
MEDAGERLGQADAFIELPDRQQAGVAGQLGCGGLNDDRQIVEKGEGPLNRSLYTHPWPPSASQWPVCSTT